MAIELSAIFVPAGAARHPEAYSLDDVCPFQLDRR
jgi:hypothetical protein